MLENIDLNKIFFIDIETVPLYPEYSAIPEDKKILWDEKVEKLNKTDEDIDNDEFYRRAGIYAEFGKIICISIGFLKRDESDYTMRVKSIYGDDEKKILTDFRDLLKKHFKSGQNYLCAHNGKEFDFPYIARRMVVNYIDLPKALDIAGKKPWETDHLLDTMHLWKFGDFKNYTSLNLLSNTLNIPTPKDDIKGSDVCDVYWKEKDIDRIVLYCEKDVLAIARLMMRFKGIDYVKDENVVKITD